MSVTAPTTPATVSADKMPFARATPIHHSVLPSKGYSLLGVLGKGVTFKLITTAIGTPDDVKTDVTWTLTLATGEQVFIKKNSARYNSACSGKDFSVFAAEAREDLLQRMTKFVKDPESNIFPEPKAPATVEATNQSEEKTDMATKANKAKATAKKVTAAKKASAAKKTPAKKTEDSNRFETSKAKTNADRNTLIKTAQESLARATEAFKKATTDKQKKSANGERRRARRALRRLGQKGGLRAAE